MRGGERVATVIDLPWQEKDPQHLERARATVGRVMLAGGLAADNVRAAIEAVRPWAVDASSRLEVKPGREGSRARARLRRGRAVADDVRPLRRPLRAGTLIPALDELEAGWRDARADPAFAAELDELGRTKPAVRRR